MAVIPTADNDWGVTVEQVSALAPHVTIGDAPAVPVDDTFHVPADRKITVNEVETWIKDVAGRVTLRLSDLGKITDTTRSAALGAAAHDTVANGAAWYVVTAAHPVGQINGDSGYGEILRARYEAAFELLGTTIDAWLVELAGKAEAQTVFGSFPAALFPDGVRF